ncbi:MAG: hypothetical protein V1809_12435 [Planctomycetota bacterium]
MSEPSTSPPDPHETLAHWERNPVHEDGPVRVYSNLPGETKPAFIFRCGRRDLPLTKPVVRIGSRVIFGFLRA